jgi:hypothetical protein
VSTTSDAVADTLAVQCPDWRPVVTRQVTLVEGLMSDGTVQYRVIRPSSQDFHASMGIIFAAADRWGGVR